MKNIVLTGFMASGKTVIGKKISELTGMKFIDTDEMIEINEKITINEIFSSYGEKYFRSLEHDIALKCSELHNHVISCGGGMVLNQENISVLKKNGMIFNLNPSEDVIRERFEESASTRPLLKNDNIDGVLKRFNERQPYYENCDFRIDIIHGNSISEIAREIINIYNEHSGGII